MIAVWFMLFIFSLVVVSLVATNLAKQGQKTVDTSDAELEETRQAFQALMRDAAEGKEIDPIQLKLVGTLLGAKGESPWQTFLQAREQLEAQGRQRAEQARTERESVAHEVSSARARVSAEQVKVDLKQLDQGHRVGRYVVAEKLGEGGFGEVFRGLLPVALKFANSSEAVDRLRHFAELQQAIQSERIVAPLEINLEADPPHIVMEYVDGTTLRDLLGRGPLKAELALPVLTEIALALRDAHQVGVAHLDLKPENVLLDTAGLVKLTDFDLGTLDAEALQMSLSFDEVAPAGTLVYMSPEQRAGKPADTRSDVYTFGVMLFEALTGTLPEPGDRPSEFVAGLPAKVDAIFERCFSRQERRYATARELVADLEQALAGLPQRADLAAAFAEIPRQAVDPAAVPRALARAKEVREAREVSEEPVEPSGLEPEQAEAAPVEDLAEGDQKEPSRPSLEEVISSPGEEDAGEVEGAPRPDLDALIAARAARARDAERDAREAEEEPSPRKELEPGA